MSAEVQTWKNKLTPKLRNVPGVNGVDAGENGLIVKIENNTEELKQKVLDVISRDGGDDVVYKTVVVGRVIALT
jgi:hypothetical protein